MPQVARVTERGGFGIRAIRSLHNSKYNSFYKDKRSRKTKMPKQLYLESIFSKIQIFSLINNKYLTTPVEGRRRVGQVHSVSSLKKRIDLLKVVKSNSIMSVKVHKKVVPIQAKSNLDLAIRQKICKKLNKCSKVHIKDRDCKQKLSSIGN